MTPDTHYLKLRANLRLPGDVALAERELRRCYQGFEAVEESSQVSRALGLPERHVLSHARPGAFPGFLCTGARLPPEKLVVELSCFQELWLPPGEHPQAAWCRTLPPESGGGAVLFPLLSVAEIAGHPGECSRGTRALLPHLAGETTALRRAHVVQSAAPYVHGIHRYKARFFPRLARVLLSSLPGDGKVLDPFVGSGTTLVEASMLGRSSVGVDIDPLSVAITRAKLDLLTCKPEELSRAIAQMGEPSGGHYEMPRVMARKFERKGTEAEKESYEVEIAGWRAALERVESVRLKRVLSMALSDAILRKFNVRMMGTGVGRFALEIRRRSLSGMVRKNLEQLVTRARLCQDLLRDYDLKPAPARVLRGDATALELPDASVHGILTSPPYLPASSGREAYLVGKSLSLTALGLMTEAEIAQAERGSLGSMKAALEGESANLPPEVYELVDWLANDPLRAIKAEPTLAYYREIKAALTESHRVLRPGHRAIFVVGRESVFYTFKTRKVLRRVPCDALFEDIARSVGFEVVDRVDVELDKRNPNARPRSRDPFYETAVMLER